MGWICMLCIMDVLDGIAKNFNWNRIVFHSNLVSLSSTCLCVSRFQISVLQFKHYIVSNKIANFQWKTKYPAFFLQNCATGYCTVYSCTNRVYLPPHSLCMHPKSIKRDPIWLFTLHLHPTEAQKKPTEKSSEVSHRNFLLYLNWGTERMRSLDSNRKFTVSKSNAIFQVPLLCFLLCLIALHFIFNLYILLSSTSLFKHIIRIQVINIISYAVSELQRVGSAKQRKNICERTCKQA